jgi:hypothetical protein
VLGPSDPGAVVVGGHGAGRFCSPSTRSRSRSR